MTVQRDINLLGQRFAPEVKIDSRFHGWSIFGVLIGSLLWVFVILGMFLPEVKQ